MSANSLGHLFRVTTFGESHGKAVGAVIDGMPAGIYLDMDAIHKQMSRRRPGQSDLSTTRREDDIPEFISGLFEGKTTGAPLAFFIPNKDVRSQDYDALREIYRPGHADYTYEQKFGIRDHRGGGRSSARTMAPWVCAGAIAAQILKELGVMIYAYVSGVGTLSMEKDPMEVVPADIDKNAVRCPDPAIAAQMAESILQVKEAGDSLGGVITCVAKGIPAGWGEPQFGKLPAQLAHAMMSINAVKGFEIGEGFALSTKKGSETNDAFEEGGKTSSNHSGGVLGGISNGMPLYFRVAFKPVSTLRIEQQSINRSGEAVVFQADGRHDPCVVPRAVPIVEAMTALVLIDLYLLQQARR
ncbi:MAG TPA: chorismate synthase [Bacteroidetes bacterium]|nr:chorismate synthase [Bacteroidota bacterium]